MKKSIKYVIMPSLPTNVAKALAFSGHTKKNDWF
jgi:hypothetical protein